MKVRLTRNPAASLNCSLNEGMIGIVPTELGELLIRLGIAEQLEELLEAPKIIKAVPDPPSISVAEPESASVVSVSKQPRKRR